MKTSNRDAPHRAHPAELDEEDDQLVVEDEVLEGDFTFRAVAVGLLVG